jgi:S1-C subfamily serine protease
MNRIFLLFAGLLVTVAAKAPAQPGTIVQTPTGTIERTATGGIFHSEVKSPLGLYTYDGVLVVGSDGRWQGAEYPIVIRLDSGSVAERAGLKINDVILSVNGNDARTGNRAFHLRPGETRFVLRIRRGDEEMELLMERAPRHQAAAP